MENKEDVGPWEGKKNPGGREGLGEERRGFPDSAVVVDECIEDEEVLSEEEEDATLGSPKADAPSGLDEKVGGADELGRLRRTARMGLPVGEKDWLGGDSSM